MASPICLDDLWRLGIACVGYMCVHAFWMVFWCLEGSLVHRIKSSTETLNSPQNEALLNGMVYGASWLGHSLVGKRGQTRPNSPYSVPQIIVATAYNPQIFSLGTKFYPEGRTSSPSGSLMTLLNLPGVVGADTILHQ